MFDRFREEIVYTEDDIKRRAREDATNNLPDPGMGGPSPYEQQLISAAEQQANNVVEDCKKQLEVVDAEIKQLQAEVDNIANAEKERIERTYQADINAIENDPVAVHAEAHLENASKAFNNRYSELARLPLSYLPHWLYIVFAVLIGIGEVPLNAIVFNIFGENQIMTWVMAVIIGLMLPISAHFVGIKVREHGERFSIANALKALVVVAVTIGALYGIASLRMAYLGEMQEDIGLTDRLVHASFDFFWINIAVFMAAIILSYLAHDPVPGYAALYRDYKRAQIQVQKARDEIAQLKRQAEETRAAGIRRMEEEKVKRSIPLNERKGEYDRILNEGQAKERRWLDQLRRDISIYRQENLNYRKDGKIPPWFNDEPSFPLRLASKKEKLNNEI